MAYYDKFKKSSTITVCSICKHEVVQCKNCGGSFINNDLEIYCNEKHEDHLCKRCLDENIVTVKKNLDILKTL